MTLRADDLPPLCPLHQDLFDTRRRDELDWPVLAERLRARLGDDALHGLACAADHRPGRAWRFAEPGNTGASARTNRAPKRSPSGIGGESARTPGTAIAVQATPIITAKPETAKTRPFWLLHRPIVLREAPARILAGPERIESGWWDERDQRRDYYVIETRRGQRAWAFVEAGAAVEVSLFAVSIKSEDHLQVHWTLHGWFA